jgi:predicted helicase
MSPKTSNNGFVFPLYLYPATKPVREQQLNWAESEGWRAGLGGRVPNLSHRFVEDSAARLGLVFTSDGPGDLKKTFGPDDVFHYAYAIFHSPTYRKRYAEFLKMDFPRLPLTRDKALFRRLCGLGAELAAVHLLEAPKVEDFITAYPVSGNHEVAKGYPLYLTPEEVQRRTGGKANKGRVCINKDQYFEGVAPELWAFHVGGYQVLEKWLRDRRGRNLSIDEINQYQRIVVALSETLRLMAEVDAAIPAWPIA